jgi:hypothetical protein
VACLSLRDCSDDGLTAVMDVNVLDPDELLPTMTKAPQQLDLGRISSATTERRGVAPTPAMSASTR